MTRFSVAFLLTSKFDGVVCFPLQFHPVPYKTIIAHFEQVINLLTVDMSYQTASGTLEWPPDPAIITAAGGVGFGGVKLDPQTNKDNICLEDVTIPPVIRTLHTKLTANAYRRYRKDPLFLYKTAMCCESCFLVYAEMASMSFQIAPPHKSSSTLGSQSRFSESRRRTPSDKWLPIDETGGRGRRMRNSSYESSRSGVVDFGATNNSSRAMNMSSEFIAQPPPDFPDAIRSVQANYSEVAVPGSTSAILERTAPVMTEEIIQKREDAFFKEMLNKGKPKDGHPLTHLITAQSKLDSLTLGAPDVGEEMKKKKKKGKRTQKLNPYQQPQKFVEVVKGGRRKGKIKKREAKDDSRVADNLAATSTAPSISASAARHRDFLLSTLSDIQDQLAAPTALKTLVESQGIEERKNEEWLSTSKPSGEEERDGGVEDDALPPDAQDATGLFKQSMKIGERLCSITAFAHHAWEGGPFQISFEIVYPAVGETWRIAVTEEDLNLDEGASLAMLPMPKLKQLAKKVVSQLSWVGSEGGEGDDSLGIVFLSLT